MQTIEAMLSVLVEEDREYVEKLKECLTRIGDNHVVAKIQAFEEEKRQQREAERKLEAERRRQEEEKRRRGQFVLDKTFAGHSDWVTSVAFSPNGELLASGSDDNTIKICRAV